MVLHPQARAAVAAASAVPPGVGARLRHPCRPGSGDREAALAGPREDVAEVTDVDADGVRCRLYRPEGALDGTIVHLHGGGFVFNDIDVHDAAARMLANRAGIAVLSVDYRKPARAPLPGRPRRRRHGARLAGPERGRPDVRPRRQRRRQPRPGRGAAAPGPVRGAGADLPVPRPDRRLRLLRHRGRRLRAGGGRVVLAAVRRVPGRPDRPRPRAAAVRPARHPAADPGRHRRARPAARRGRAPRPAARGGGRRGWSAPATSARCTASGGMPTSSTPRSR